jgi:hypothetical protein
MGETIAQRTAREQPRFSAVPPLMISESMDAVRETLTYTRSLAVLEVDPHIDQRVEALARSCDPTLHASHSRRRLRPKSSP